MCKQQGGARFDLNGVIYGKLKKLKETGLGLLAYWSLLKVFKGSN